MYSYLLTARCHPADVSYFEEFLPIFFTKFSQNEYYWSIEQDGTCDRHLHYLSRGENPKDLEKVVAKFNTKIFQEFKKRLIDTETQWIDKITDDNPGSGFLNIKTVPKEEFGVTIGYLLKEVPARRYTGKLKSDEIENFINLYYINVRNKAKTRDPEIDALKLLSGRTILTKTIDYCKRSNTRYDCPELYYNMVKSGYFFYNISSQIRARCFRELRIFKEQENIEDKSVLLQENSDDKKHIQETQEQEDILSLLKILKTKELNHFEFQTIKNISYQNHIYFDEL